MNIISILKSIFIDKNGFIILLIIGIIIVGLFVFNYIKDLNHIIEIKENEIKLKDTNINTYINELSIKDKIIEKLNNEKIDYINELNSYREEKILFLKELNSKLEEREKEIQFIILNIDKEQSKNIIIKKSVEEILKEIQNSKKEVNK